MPRPSTSFSIVYEPTGSIPISARSLPPSCIQHIDALLLTTFLSYALSSSALFYPLSMGWSSSRLPDTSYIVDARCILDICCEMILYVFQFLCNRPKRDAWQGRLGR